MLYCSINISFNSNLFVPMTKRAWLLQYLHYIVYNLFVSMTKRAWLLQYLHYIVSNLFVPMTKRAWLRITLNTTLTDIGILLWNLTVLLKKYFLLFFWGSLREKFHFMSSCSITLLSQESFCVNILFPCFNCMWWKGKKKS